MLVDVLIETYAEVTGAVSSLPDADFARPTRTVAWNVRELLFHQLLDAQRSLVALASTTQAVADVDSVTYWRPFRPSAGDGGAAHAGFVQVAASAYADPASLVGHWRTTSSGLLRAAGAADPSARVETQGHVIEVADLVSTLVVESTVHLLDLTLEIAGGPPPAAALVETRRVLEALLERSLPVGWDAVEAVLKATGRVELTGADRAALGTSYAAFPLLG